MNIEDKEKTIEDVDEITIQYKIDDIENCKDIRIFGDHFVDENKDKCKIIINGNENDLSAHLNINNIKELNNNIFEIKLKGIKRIINTSCMFDSCELLSSLPDISKWNTENITDMSCMFRDCKILSSLSDISKWNTQSVSNISYIFCRCRLLSSIPDISKWNTQKMTDINSMFLGCSALSS